MKKNIVLLLLAAILLTSCTNTIEPVNETQETERESETVPDEADIGESEEPTEETLILDSFDPESETETDSPVQTQPNDGKTSDGDGVITMTIPTQYKQVYEVIKECFEAVVPDYEVEEEVAVDEAIAETLAVAETAAEVEAPTSTESSFSKSTVSTDPDAFSKTNTQVAEIDEGDIVKTDGEYIYVLKDEEILLILTADGENTEVISKTTLDLEHEDKMWAEELYIYGDTLLVLSGCREYGVYSNSVRVTAYDVSDPTDPDRIAYTGQDGSYVTSRLVNGDLYVISNFNLPLWNDYEAYDYASYIPELYRNGEVSMLEPSRIVYPDTPHLASYAVIVRYSAESGEIKDSKSLLGAGDTVYMSENYLYIAGSYRYDETSEPYQDTVYSVVDHRSGNRTEIYKFSLGETIKTVAVGEVEGTLLNQFAMDEYDGHLRVVTTYQPNIYSVYTDEKMGFSNYKWHDNTRKNGLYVFDENMELVGEVDELAEGERVYSVRFSGEVGYFVTFRTVDPLFTVDLSDPTAPKIMSELKIPGFSNYLHQYSEGLLFGLGQDADENTGRTNGMKLSMFDVSDPYDVTEKHKLLLEFSSSEALENHKAILISPSKDIIGFPYYSGYVIYGYNENGFYERSRVELENIHWKGDSRGLYVGDDVYIVTQTCTVVLDMTTFDVIAAVEY